MNRPRAVLGSVLSEPEPSDWRARKKAATRQAVQDHALRLFLEKGFEATTVEEIAAAAGVSHMTFFRYFKTKEDVAASDDYDPLIGALVAARPPDEPIVEKIRHAFATGLAQIYAADRAALLTRTRLILGTPALRARLWDNQAQTQQYLVSVLSDRTGAADPAAELGEAVPGEQDLALEVVVAACLSAAATAVRIWADNEDATELPDLIDRAFAALSAAVPGAAPPPRICL